jgi:ABC-type glycerol-3-phosphate transport system substrate-binding protein
MKSMTPFQLIVTGAFAALTLIGVGVFAAFGGLGGTSVGQVVIWGTIDNQTMANILQTMRNSDKSFQDVTYVQRDPSSYDQDLVNAIASGNSPDLFLISQEELGTFANKVSVIPYSAVSQSNYTNSFIDESSLFQTSQGAYALPFMVDPLVMYYNRDLLATAGVAQAPESWNDFLTLSPKITSLDSSQNVHTSAVALGSWDNVANAKAILSALFMQAGDPLVGRDSQGYLMSVFGQTPQNAAENPASSALRFYTEFANPSKTSYSWNRSLPLSTQAFEAGDLAVYFGLASEASAIAQANPNLHFGVAVLPQLTGSTVHLTFGYLSGVAISRAAHNPTGALTIAEKLTSQAGIQAVVAGTNLPPVRRDVGVDTTASAALQVFAQSALIARGWFDPNPAQTNQIFSSMVQSVTTGANDPASAVNEAAQEFMQLFH